MEIIAPPIKHWTSWRYSAVLAEPTDTASVSGTCRLAEQTDYSPIQSNI
jgi:hypothetical protein